MFKMFELCRATPDEVRRTLPGDEMIPHPIVSPMHAITIDVSPDRVWPWLVQLGCGRAGWYSYDFLDNGGRSRSLLPSVQFALVLEWSPIREYDCFLYM